MMMMMMMTMMMTMSAEIACYDWSTPSVYKYEGRVERRGDGQID